MAQTRAVLSMQGAGCTSCAYAIERTGRRLPGVSEIFVDIAQSQIRVAYDDAHPDVPDQIIGLVNRIGHDAVRVESDCGGPCPTCTCEGGKKTS